MAITKKPYALITLLGVLSALAILLYFSFNPERGLLFPKCPFNQMLGIHCAGCGSQRAIHDLLHFRITDAISHNVLLLPAFFVVSQHLLTKIGILKGTSLLHYRYAPAIILLIIVLFMVLRNIPGYPFEYLAP